MQGLMEFATDKIEGCSFKVTFSSDSKNMSMVYSDGVFSRLVKLPNKYTLYVNTGKAIDRIMNRNVFSSFSVCCGLPGITTCIELYKNMAEVSQCSFDMITSNS